MDAAKARSLRLPAFAEWTTDQSITEHARKDGGEPSFQVCLRAPFLEEVAISTTVTTREAPVAAAVAHREVTNQRTPVTDLLSSSTSPPPPGARRWRTFRSLVSRARRRSIGLHTTTAADETLSTLRFAGRARSVHASALDAVPESGRPAWVPETHAPLDAGSWLYILGRQRSSTVALAVAESERKFSALDAMRREVDQASAASSHTSEGG